MIVFNECRIDKEGKNLIIDASIEDLEYFNDMSINALIIDTEDTFIDKGPSNNCIYNKRFKIPSDNSTILDLADSANITILGNKISNNKLKNIRISLTAKDLNLDNLSNNIFFVYLEAIGIPDPSTPCGLDNKISMAVALDFRPIYNMSIKHINELDSKCNIPKGFIDIILRIKALELALKTGNYQIAIKQWNKLFKNKGIVPTIKNCNCYGIIY